MKKSNLLIFLLFLMIPFVVNSSNCEENAEYINNQAETKVENISNLDENSNLNKVELLLESK